MPKKDLLGSLIETFHFKIRKSQSCPIFVHVDPYGLYFIINLCGA